MLDPPANPYLVDGLVPVATNSLRVLSTLPIRTFLWNQAYDFGQLWTENARANNQMENKYLGVLCSPRWPVFTLKDPLGLDA